MRKLFLLSSFLFFLGSVSSFAVINLGTVGMLDYSDSIVLLGKSIERGMLYIACGIALAGSFIGVGLAFSRKSKSF